MAFGLPAPLINGVRHSWSSVSVKVAGLTIGGITEVNYAPKLEAAVVRGAGPLPIAHTTGQASYTADMTMLLQEANDLIAALGAAWMTAMFDVEVGYSDEGYTASGVGTYTDMIKRCRITEFSVAASNGSADALVRKFTLLPLELLINGTNPMPNQPSLSIGGVAGTATGVINRLI